MFTKHLTTLLLLLGVLLESCATHHPSVSPPSMTYSKRLFDPTPFVLHEGGPMQSYLARSVDFRAAEGIRKQVEREKGLELKNRGEAHITVITPVEFDRYFRPKQISMAEVVKFIGSERLQNLTPHPLCVGEGEVLMANKAQNMQTYFVVVDDKDLKALRSEIFKHFQIPEEYLLDFFPHITLGFTHRDLHVEDGVKKDQSLCRWKLSANNP